MPPSTTHLILDSQDVDHRNWRDRLGLMLGLIEPTELPSSPPGGQTNRALEASPPVLPLNARSAGTELPLPPELDTRVQAAISFATRAHHGQTRADGRTPYIAHPMRVAYVLHHRFKVDDTNAYIAALLHDTIEDTKTTYDVLSDHFGDGVARMVAVLTKDERLPARKRDDIYYAGLETASWQTKAIKMADSYDNVLDSATSKNPRKKLAAARRSLALADDGHPQLMHARHELSALIEKYAPSVEGTN